MQGRIDWKRKHEECDLHCIANSRRNDMVVIKLPIHELLELISRHPRGELGGNLQEIKDGLLRTGNLQLGEEKKGNTANEDEHNQHERRKGNDAVDEMVSTDGLLDAVSATPYRGHYCTSVSYTV